MGALFVSMVVCFCTGHVTAGIIFGVLWFMVLVIGAMASAM